MDSILKALNFIFIILEVLLIFNLLIIVHEIGHFLAARWRGLYVDGFGIWFGKPIWKKKINGVTYSLGSIPAGGFVKLPQMAPMEAMEGETEVDIKSLPPISPLDKIIVAFAGPLFSFGLACVFAVIVWQVGKPVSEAESSTTVAFIAPDSPAEKAEFKIGDKILEVDGKPVGRWGGMGEDSITWRIVRSEGKTIPIKVIRADGTTKTLEPEPIVPEKAHWWNRAGLRQVGLMQSCTPVIFEVEENSLAKRMGLQKNDVLSEINGEKLLSPESIYVYLKDHPNDEYKFTVLRGTEKLTIPFVPGDVKVAGIPDYPNSPALKSELKVGDMVTGIDGKRLPGSLAVMDYVRNHAGQEITLNVKRDGKPVDIKITPEIPERAPNNSKSPKIGVNFEDVDGFKFDGMGIPTPSNPKPVEQVRSSMAMILNTLDAVVSSKSSIGLQHMGGPVMMMRAYYMMFENKDGWKLALWFSVILNVNLALINLLPIPVLDGGHITLAIVEWIRRKPVNIKVLEIIQSACAIVIIGFMLFIVFFDVQDLSPFLSDKTPTIQFKATETK